MGGCGGCCDEEAFVRLDKKIDDTWNRFADLANRIPGNVSELPNDIGYVICEELSSCQTIIDIMNSIPSDVSDLTDSTNLLFSGDYNDLINSPTNISYFNNDVGYVTVDTTYTDGQGIRLTGTQFDQEFNVVGTGDVLDIQQTTNGLQVNKGQIDYNNLANTPDLSGYIDCTTLASCQTIVDLQNNMPTDLQDLTDTTNLLFSGDYNDLINQPTIGNGELDIQLNGITVEKFNANDVANTIANIIAQETLVSGVNIKTVNGQSILGSGDIPIPTPSVPNDGVLTIERNSVSQGTFTADQAGNTTVDISVPEDLNDLTDTTSILTGKEDTTNKATDFSTINDTLYPTVKAVNDQINGLSTLQLGETSSTAYRGDRGKIAYDLSQEIDTTMDFTLGLTNYFIVDYAGLKINSVQNILNTPTVTLTVSGVPYVLGTPLSLGTRLDVSVNTASVIKLKGTR